MLLNPTIQRRSIPFILTEMPIVHSAVNFIFIFICKFYWDLKNVTLGNGQVCSFNFFSFVKPPQIRKDVISSNFYFWKWECFIFQLTLTYLGYYRWARSRIDSFNKFVKYNKMQREMSTLSILLILLLWLPVSEIRQCVSEYKTATVPSAFPAVAPPFKV